MNKPAGPLRPAAQAPVLNAVKLMYAAAAVITVALIISVTLIGDAKAALRTANPSLTAAQFRDLNGLITLAIVSGLVVAALWLWMARANGQGRNWARILATVLFGLATLELITITTSDSAFEVGPAIMGGVPPQNPNFTGRDTILMDLKTALWEHNRAAVLPHTLHGLGGVGKSQLAIEYARRFQADYELIWWIPADDEAYIRRSFVSLARRLNLPESNDWRYTVETVLEQLRLGSPTPNWLLIYDRADDPQKLQTFLPSGSGRVLITSRNQSWVNQSTV